MCSDDGGMSDEVRQTFGSLGLSNVFAQDTKGNAYQGDGNGEDASNDMKKEKYYAEWWYRGSVICLEMRIQY
ncbi:hypothetical protein COOONC_21213 [Cooperia oncophora]